MDATCTPSELRWRVPCFPLSIPVLNATEASVRSHDRLALERARAAWVTAMGLGYTDNERDENSFEDRAWDPVTQCWRLTQAFFGVVCRVASRMHESGVIREIFGRSIPVIPDEHDASPEIHAARALAANPPDLVVDHLRFVFDRCR